MLSLQTRTSAVDGRPVQVFTGYGSRQRSVNLVLEANQYGCRICGCRKAVIRLRCPTASPCATVRGIYDTRNRTGFTRLFTVPFVPGCQLPYPVKPRTVTVINGVQP
jgi:hypothetical protein